jgi:formylglycine-generating enzyme required for sulfatase activity
MVVTGEDAVDQNAGAGTMAVQFNISWNYSWRLASGPSNWDAAWVFVKFRKNGGDWTHASLMNTGHTAPSGSTIDTGLLDPGSAFNIATNPGVGAFIYRSSAGFGKNTFNNAKLVWNYAQDGVSQGDAVDVQVHSLHMVYVPQEAFYAGDLGSSNAAFRQGSSDTDPWYIGSEAQMSITNSTGTAGGSSNEGTETRYYYTSANGTGEDTSGSAFTISASYPKGYNDFYIMRHELTQEQWRNFFNSLPTTGNARTNRDITSSSGKSSDNLINRNNLSWDSTTISNQATLPDRNSPNGETYCQNPASFLNWEDLAAYLDWAGLRPMTELEFEKAARGPNSPVANEYAWGSTNATQATGITNGGRITEVPSPSGANSTWNNGTTGPVRIGSFAALNYGGASRENAGAGYYGVMELSSNVWEQIVTVGNASGRAFTGVHGNGSLDSNGIADAANWPNNSSATSGAGVRGGNYQTSQSFSQLSDRSSASTTSTGRNRRTGGRGVRTAP